METAYLNPKHFGIASAIIALILDISGYIWHGLLQQPSTMNLLYPGFWSNPTLLAYGLAGTLIGLYVLGYIFAWLYNRLSKK
ncbi:MAG: hypothetical protein HY367_01715 [Candidatus Aenigmarchaeota archaeon]|nr:hypothetical protein [Candidatus Aenigmarchaeota archaeon]